MATNWANADAVGEPVISLDLLQHFFHCPWPQIPAVEGLIHIWYPCTKRKDFMHLGIMIAGAYGLRGGKGAYDIRSNIKN